MALEIRQQATQYDRRLDVYLNDEYIGMVATSDLGANKTWSATLEVLNPARLIEEASGTGTSPKLAVLNAFEQSRQQVMEYLTALGRLEDQVMQPPGEGQKQQAC